jgi:para-aminobenzoate synthetase component I
MRTEATRRAAAFVDAVLAALPPGPACAVRSAETTIIGWGASEVRRAQGSDAFALLDGLAEGWWAGFLAYDLGRAVERVPDRAPPDPEVPDLLLGRFDARIEVAADGEVRVLGRGPARATLEGLLAGLGDPLPAEPPALRGWRSSLSREAFEAGVGRIIEHLVAGDCYQVNLTRRLEREGVTDPVALHRTLLRGNPAPHAAMLRFDDIAVVSASPERFLRRDGSRVQTRPIKGTGTDPDALRRSEKDRAENVMIVDLARNDLGRVCEYGSVQTPAICEVERHPGLYHLVSTVQGTLRTGVRAGALVRAMFPPASITGAPKPRVMQIIETLEPVRRGVYCGAIGFIDADADVLDVNVAIRTFTMAAGRTSFGVGGGIVADSVASDEWAETELKAARLLALASGELRVEEAAQRDG